MERLTLLQEYILDRGLVILEDWEIIDDEKDRFTILTPNGILGVDRCTFDFWRNKNAGSDT